MKGQIYYHYINHPLCSDLKKIFFITVKFMAFGYDCTLAFNSGSLFLISFLGISSLLAAV